MAVSAGAVRRPRTSKLPSSRDDDAAVRVQHGASTGATRDAAPRDDFQERRGVGRTRIRWHRWQIAQLFVQSRATGATRVCERRLARALSPREFCETLAGEERLPVVV